MDQSTKLDLALAGTAVLVSWAKEADERMVQVEDDIAALKSHRRESTVQQRATADEVAELRKRLDSLESET
jgi:septal ring factor EnvC (AmiA/AmiB activator)